MISPVLHRCGGLSQVDSSFFRATGTPLQQPRLEHTRRRLAGYTLRPLSRPPSPPCLQARHSASRSTLPEAIIQLNPTTIPHVCTGFG